jgi:mannosyltransferase
MVDSSQRAIAPARATPSLVRSVPWAAAAPPALVTLLLGLWGLRREDSLWRDEAVTYQVAHRSLSEIWHLLGNADVVHGAYYLLMHGMFAMWDGGVVALRLPSVVAMVAAAVGVAAIGHRLAGPRVGLAAGLVFSVPPDVQRYAQEGRSYALVCALVVWSTYLLLRRAWAAYAVVLLAACWLHEFAVLVLLAHAVTLCAERHSWRAVRHWRIAALTVVAGLMPLVVVSAGQSEQVDWIPRPGWSQVAGFLLLAGAAVPCAIASRAVNLSTLALPLLLLPLATLMLVSVIHPVFVQRYVLYCEVGFALLVGAGVEWALRTRPRWAVLVLLVAVLALLPVTLHLRSPESRSDDATQLARTVARLGGPGTGWSSCRQNGATWPWHTPRTSPA